MNFLWDGSFAAKQFRKLRFVPDSSMDAMEPIMMISVVMAKVVHLYDSH